MDVRHEEFMAMADAFLGKDFDRKKLIAVEVLQLRLHDEQAELYKQLESHQIDKNGYVEKVNKVHVSIARSCEKILGARNFRVLFGATPNEICSHIDKAVFVA